MIYKSLRTLANEYDCSIDTVRRMSRRMSDYVGKRYNPEVIVRIGREVRIEETAFRDWAKWWPALVMGYSVPDYEWGKNNEGDVFRSKETLFRNSNEAEDGSRDGRLA